MDERGIQSCSLCTFRENDSRRSDFILSFLECWSTRRIRYSSRYSRGSCRYCNLLLESLIRSLKDHNRTKGHVNWRATQQAENTNVLAVSVVKVVVSGIPK